LKRKIIQLAVTESNDLYALCDDGTVWVLMWPPEETNPKFKKWKLLNIDDVTGAR
jgi:hypothetical protein